MNNVKEYIDETQRQALEEERARRRRAAIAKKRREKRRKQRIRFAVSMGVVLVVLCLGVGAFLNLTNKDSYHERVSKTSGVEKTENRESEVSVTPKKQSKKSSSKYASLSYYDETREDRYNNYASINPEMSIEDVVWRVNANQDMPKYEYDVPVSGYDDPYIIVNKYYKVPEGYEPPDLVDVGGERLRKDTAEAYKKMRSDAQKEGYDFYVVSGYRSVELQTTVYNGYLDEDAKENVDRYSARPGYSEHHTGMAMDLYGTIPGLREFEKSKEYPWVRDNCYKYGFIIRYQKETEDITGYEAEPWHLRYVGVKVSNQMREENIASYEEYYAKYLHNR